MAERDVKEGEKVDVEAGGECVFAMRERLRESQSQYVLNTDIVFFFELFIFNVLKVN